MALHYTTIAKVFAGCSIVVCTGSSETGKTTALRSALSLIGMCSGIHVTIILEHANY